MSHVPSSAILSIVVIISACLIGAFIFVASSSEQENGNRAIAKITAMSVSMEDSDILQYDGAAVTGSQLLPILKAMKHSGIAVVINNGKQSTQYLNKLSTYDDMSATGKLSATADNTGDKGDSKYSELLGAAKNKAKTAYYITPTGNFIGKIIRDSKSKAIIGVVFSLNGEEVCLDAFS